MLNGGDSYLRDVLTDAGMRSAEQATPVDSVLAASRARVAALVGARVAATSLSHEQLSALRDEWYAMSSSLRALLGADVDKYLAPPHASPHGAQHRAGVRNTP